MGTMTKMLNLGGFNVYSYLIYLYTFTKTKCLINVLSQSLILNLLTFFIYHSKSNTNRYRNSGAK